MSSHIRPRLTAGEISGLIGALPLVAGTILAFLVTSSWTQWKDGRLGGRSLRRSAVASLGTLVALLNPRQVRALLSHTTGQAIEEYCAAADLPLRSALVPNPDGFPPARLHFVNCELAQQGPILLYFQYVFLSFLFLSSFCICVCVFICGRCILSVSTACSVGSPFLLPNFAAVVVS